MPLLWLSVSFFAGLLIAERLPAFGWLPLAAALVFVALACLEQRFFSRLDAYRSWRGLARLPAALLLAAGCLGIARYQALWSPVTENDLAWYNGRGDVRVEGVIQQMPQVDESLVQLRVAVERLTPLAEGKPHGETFAVQGLALVYLPVGREWRYGDRVQLDGRLEETFYEGVPYFSENLARQGVYTLLRYPSARLVESGQGGWFWSALYRFRALADRTLERMLPQPESALLAGILLGDEHALPDSVAKSFRTTGISHILAVSGFNIAIISALVFQLFGRLMRARYAVPLALLAVSAYTLLTGASPSVVRAAIMGGFGMVGPLLGRRQVGVNSLAFTAALMCLFDPRLPWNLSFQLSFGATLGLVLYAAPLQNAFRRLAERRLSPQTALRLAGPVGEFFLFTLAAQLFTLPITALRFQQVSWSALLVNPLVLPAQPLAMIIGGSALLLGLVWLPLGQIAAWLCWPLLAYTIHTAETLAQLQHSLLNVGGLSAPLVVFYYGALLSLPALQSSGAPWIVKLRGGLRAVVTPSLALGMSALITVGLWRAAFSAPDGRLHVDVLNGKDGPALLLRSPVGQAWLVNGVSSSDHLFNALGQRLPLFSTHLDGVVVPYERPAAVWSAFDTLAQRYVPNFCAHTPDRKAGAALKRFEAHLLLEGVRCVSSQEISTFDLGGGVVLHLVAGETVDSALWLEMGGFHLLIPQSVPPEKLFGVVPGQISLLLLSPGDLKNAAPEIWSSIFRPQGVLWAGGGSAPNGAIVLDAYEWVSIQADGTHFWLEGKKK